MMLDWFWRCQQTKSLFSSSGMNFLSLLHFFSSVVSPGQMYGNISRYWWIYFSSRSLVWGIRFYCAGDIGGYGFLWIECYCVRDSISYVSVGCFFLVYQCGFWYIGESWRRGIMYRLPVLPLHIPVWYTYGLICDQVVHPVINGEKK